jgi:hypothetical protein
MAPAATTNAGLLEPATLLDTCAGADFVGEAEAGGETEDGAMGFGADAEEAAAGAEGAGALGL